MGSKTIDKRNDRATTMTTEKKRILIVDDEENLTWSMENNLKREFKHHEILSVNSGDQALEMLNKLHIDLVISDIQMPGTDGLTLLDYITENLPDSKVILMTSLDNPELRKIADEFGIYFFEKPFEMAEFKKAVHQILEKIPQIAKKSRIDGSLQKLILLQNEKKFTGCLTIKNESVSGRIFFQTGEIIHAQTHNYDGEMALINILSWDNVSYDAIATKKNQAGEQFITVGNC